MFVEYNLTGRVKLIFISLFGYTSLDLAFWLYVCATVKAAAHWFQMVIELIVIIAVFFKLFSHLADAFIQSDLQIRKSN